MTKVSGILHLRPIDIESLAYSNHGGVTIAYSVRENGNVRLAYAVCSHQDRFNRKVGRQIATGRLESFEAKDQIMAAELDSSSLEFLAKEVFGVDAKIDPKQGRNGELYVDRDAFPLAKILIYLTRPIIVELLHREAEFHGMRLVESFDEDAVVLTSYKSGLGWHFSDLELGERVI